VRGYLAALVLVLAQAASAQEVSTSPRPPENPRLAVPSIGPEPRPVAAAAAAANSEPTREPGTEAASEPAPEPVSLSAALPEGALERSLRPMPRPAKLAERLAALRSTSNAPGLDLSTPDPGDGIDLAAVAPPSRKEERRKRREKESLKGSVCGVAAIKGEEIAPITSKVQGCGVEEPVRVTSVAGVRLSQAATVDCSIAKSLNAWVDEVAQPAFDGKLVELRVAAHYICRSRNNVRGAKISEHGKGRAIDISALVLSNGTVLTVRDNYNKLMRRIYKAGCSYFRTTLGPGSDGYHEDHFHFDASARKGGAYCR
jgi:hypothetical protein